MLGSGDQFFIVGWTRNRAEGWYPVCVVVVIEVGDGPGLLLSLRLAGLGA